MSPQKLLVQNSSALVDQARELHRWNMERREICRLWLEYARAWSRQGMMKYNQMLRARRGSLLIWLHLLFSQALNPEGAHCDWLVPFCKKTPLWLPPRLRRWPRHNTKDNFSPYHRPCSDVWLYLQHVNRQRESLKQLQLCSFQSERYPPYWLWCTLLV